MEPCAPRSTLLSLQQTSLLPCLPTRRAPGAAPTSSALPPPRPAPPASQQHQHQP